jgi:hypothetical protein
MRREGHAVPEPLVVEFDLSAQDALRLHPRERTIRIMVYVGLFSAVVEALAVLSATLHRGSDAKFVPVIVLVPLLVALTEWLIVQGWRANRARSTGAARITLSDNGIEYRDVRGRANIEWTRVQSLFERPEFWTICTSQPDRRYHFPKSAVPIQRAHLADELSTWSGKPVRHVKR